MTTVNNTYQTMATSQDNSQNSDNSQKAVNNSMGKDEFLKLLVAQLKNQDPMSPMQDGEFVAQLAQFSSLEQMYNVSASMEALRYSMTMLYSQSLLTQGAALIGKEAVGIDAAGEEISGRITSVSWLDGSLVVMVGDTLLGLDSIMEIKEPGSPSATDPTQTDGDEDSESGKVDNENPVPEPEEGDGSTDNGE